MDNKFSFQFSKQEWLMILVVSFGYFVDLYDLLLFSAVRQKSLLAIGVAEADLANVGLSIMNYQLIGLLIGGILYGVISDKKGRVSVLFVSILTYSIATLLNAFVNNVFSYSLLRFIAGVGLAAEFGIGITLLSEYLPRQKRTVSTMVVGSFGMLGAVLAAIMALLVSWQKAYIIGSIMGLVLLLFRLNLKDSDIFNSLKKSNVEKGSFIKLLTNPKLLKRYLYCILAGTPIFIFIGIFVTLSPEIGKEMGLSEKPNVSIVLIVFYLLISISDIFGSYISKKIQSRKKTLFMFLSIQLIAVITLFLIPINNLFDFYIRYGFLAVGIGCWAVLITNAAEQFGTNIRGTVTTSVPNFIRAISVPISLFVFKPLVPIIGMVGAGLVVGISSVLIGLLAVSQLRDNFENNVDYIEEFK